FRAKMAQENLIRASSIPYSIVRATQFFEFIKAIIDFSTNDKTVCMPSALIQPMAADDVASGVAQVVVGRPGNGMIEIGGPEELKLDELARKFLAARSDSREVVTDPHAGYYGVEIAERTLTPGEDARLGKTRFDEWLTQPAPVASAAKGS